MAITIGNAVGLGSDYSVTTGVGAVDANTQRVTIADAYPKSGNATAVSLGASAASQTLKASNSARIGFFVTNTSANVSYINYGATAASTSFVAMVPANGGYWVMPTPVYTGVLSAIWTGTGTGSLIGTELTP
jgi:hypothetical protein